MPAKKVHQTPHGIGVEFEDATVYVRNAAPVYIMNGEMLRTFVTK